MKNPFKLSDRQLNWFNYREVKVGSILMLPRFGFHAYMAPEGGAIYMDTNPLTKSLDNAPIEVLEVRNHFYRVNFCERRAPRDWWMDASIELRDPVARILLFSVCYLPMVVYNMFAE